MTLNIWKCRPNHLTQLHFKGFIELLYAATVEGESRDTEQSKKDRKASERRTWNCDAAKSDGNRKENDSVYAVHHQRKTKEENRW